MITKFNIFESVSTDVDEIEIGDWVVVEYIAEIDINDELNTYYNSHIGQLIEKTPNTYNYIGDFIYYLRFDIDEEDLHNFNMIKDEVVYENGKYYIITHTAEHEILYFSKNKEDLKIYADTNKYNL